MINDAYRKARRNLLARVRRLEKKGVTVDREQVIPPKPKRITAGSVSRLNALTAERILAKSGVKQARPVKPKEPKEVKTRIKKKLPVKKTRTEEFREAWDRELNRLDRVINRLEGKGTVAKRVNIRKEFPVPIYISPAKFRALHNITPGQLERMFPPPEGPKRRWNIPVRRGALVPASKQPPELPDKTETVESELPDKTETVESELPDKTETVESELPGEPVTMELHYRSEREPAKEKNPEDEIRKEAMRRVLGTAKVNGIWFDPETGKVISGENADKAKLYEGMLIDTRTGEIIWKSPDAEQGRLESAGGILYDTKTGEVVAISDAAKNRYGVMPGDEDRFIVSEHGGLIDTRTGEWISDREAERVAESPEVVTGESPEAVTGETTGERKETARERKKREREQYIADKKRYRYNPETDTVEEVPYWDDEPEDTVSASVETILSGLTETDRKIYEIMHDESLPHDYARIQEILKTVKSRPARLPAESYEDYLKRLIQHIRTRAYQDELGDFPERDTGESAESYLKRLAALMEAKGHETLTRIEENKENAIRGAIAKNLGYDPFKPVDENDAAPVDMVLGYIIKHWDILKGNLPRGFSYYGKPDEVGIRLALEKMDERSRRNFYYARKAAVARDKARKQKYTPVENLPEMTAEEAIDMRFDSLVKKFRGTDIEEQAKSLKELWEGVKKREGNNLVGFLKERGNNIVRELDDLVPDWWEYYINMMEANIGLFTLPDTKLIMALGTGFPLAMHDVTGREGTA